MLSGHLQGRILSMLSSLANPLRILEIGTYTGYSALCLAEGLQENGLLFTIDPNEETNHFANSYFQRSPFAGRIRLMQGQAAEIIPTLNETFDVVFIDADKKSYGQYFDLVLPKLRKGGIIISDNVLWSGKVLNAEMDAETKAIHQYNQKLSSDPRVKTVLMPVRDGLSVCRKI
jgi:predicted O-methyltransferase YrrM